MQNAEHHREQFELAYATAWAKDRDGSETPEQLAAEIKSWRIGDTYGQDLPRLRFGWEGYQWARASQCLAQIEEPAGAAPAAVAPLPAVLEQIAQGWDGCKYDAPGETLDIGADIRAAAKRLLAAAAPALEAPAAVEFAMAYGGRRVPAYGKRGDPVLLYPDDLARMLAAAPQAPAAPAVVATSDTALLDAMERERIAVIPEFEGPWDAQIFGEDEATLACGSGATPREAITEALASLDARKAHDAAQDKEGGDQ